MPPPCAPPGTSATGPARPDALTNLGDVRRLTGDYPGAVRDLEEALDIYRDLGDRLGQANALTNLGKVRRLTGDYPAAARDLRRRWTSTVTSATGPARPTPSPTWGSCGGRPGTIRPRPGTWRRRWTSAVDLGDRLGQADALTNLGDVRR